MVGEKTVFEGEAASAKMLEGSAAVFRGVNEARMCCCVFQELYNKHREK